MVGRITVLVSLVLVCACRSETTPLPRVQPFSDLHGVEIGMTAGTLREVRPAVEFAAYTGLREELSEGTIYYHIESTMTEHAEPSNRRRISGISIENYMRGRAAEAEAEYYRITDEWESVLGEPGCEDEGESRGTSVWAIGGLELVARWTTEKPPVTPTIVVLSFQPDSVLLNRCRAKS
jgi:hypothetical protein